MICPICGKHDTDVRRCSPKRLRMMDAQDRRASLEPEIQARTRSEREQEIREALEELIDQ